jgi:hypothetical protein
LFVICYLFKNESISLNELSSELVYSIELQQRAGLGVDTKGVNRKLLSNQIHLVSHRVNLVQIPNLVIFVFLVLTFSLDASLDAVVSFSDKGITKEKNTHTHYSVSGEIKRPSVLDFALLFCSPRFYSIKVGV